MKHFSVAGLQLELKDGDNLALVEDEIRATAARFPWVEMILLAELGIFGVSKRRAESLLGETLTRLQRAAKDAGVWLVPGSLYERDGDRIFNTTPVIDPAGRLVARYRKRYPFLPYEAGVAAGDEATVFDIPGVGRFGISICYDMWFPETVRALAWAGAEVILHPSLTNTIDRDVELAIARSAAATNQCYFLDLNVGGDLGLGRSGFFGPGGEVLHVAPGSTREVIAVELDLGRVRRLRERGWNGLGQMLKSFRDGPASFPPYGADRAASPALDALGPLVMPKKPNEGGEP